MTTIVKFTGFQQLTTANLGASIALTPVVDPVTGEAPNAALMTSFTGNTRFTADGTTPTAAVGLRLTAGADPFLYIGDLKSFLAIKEGGSPTLDVAYCIAVD